ncbi:MAG: ABC transporter ATP-binding protein [Acidimicrobiales bacterium]
MSAEDKRPVAIRGLTKRYAGGVLAVEGLDLSVEEGQVLGLLGPNGAGKTTTLRMLLGLVLPSAGEVRIYGERVLPGASVLSRVGTLVDNPGFVPHLSGIRNLQTFWEAGGMAWSEADVDAAIEVADLGEAINRKYRTYSHGMRQRLGLAQSVLGRPSLLVLDEPTSGLDPHQMRQVRAVVSRMAAGGTTVVLSSHLLSEVEQVCTHVAVVDRGHLVSTGPVADLTGASRTVYIETTDLDAAKRVLSALEGVTSVTDQPPGMSVSLKGTPRHEVVAALVHAGVGVDTIHARNSLEDAFLELVGEASP